MCLLHLCALSCTLPRYDDFYSMSAELSLLIKLLSASLALLVALLLYAIFSSSRGAGASAGASNVSSLAYTLLIGAKALPLASVCAVELAYVSYRTSLPIWLHIWYAEEIVRIHRGRLVCHLGR